MNEEELQYLENHIKTIPNMVNSKREEDIFNFIEKTCMNLNDDEAIVELGCWLGYITSNILYALVKHNKNNPVYVYDNFVINENEKIKAGKRGLILKNGEDSLKLVKDNLKPFGYDNIYYIKTRIEEVKEFNENKIGFLIDDATKGKRAWDVSLNVFFPKLTTNSKIFLMDYNHYKKSGKDVHKNQKRYMENNENFEFLGELGSEEGVFIYNGKER